MGITGSSNSIIESFDKSRRQRTLDDREDRLVEVQIDNYIQQQKNQNLLDTMDLVRKFHGLEKTTKITKQHVTDYKEQVKMLHELHEIQTTTEDTTTTTTT